MIKLYHYSGDVSKVYLPVAEIASDDLEYAFKVTQNGAVSDSWSQIPPEHVKPLGDGYHLVNHRRYGYRSSMVGDRFELNGVMFECSSVGFKEVEKV